MPRFLALLITILITSCTSTQLAKWRGKTVYNKVGIKAEDKGSLVRAFSTNYYGVPVFFPINSKFRVTAIKGDYITLSSEKLDKPFQIIYVAKHNRMPFEDYLAMIFSSRKTKMSKAFSKKEKKLIRQGKFESGMSRKAFYTSIGYPPASLNASLQSNSIVYERKRFNKTRFIFNRNGRLEKWVD